MLSTGAVTGINYENASPQTFDKISLSNNNQGFFGEYQSKDYEYVKSSLRVSAEKWTYLSNNKWRGSLTWAWSFSNSRTNKGFITYNKAETTADKKLRLTGVFYLLEKSNGKWEIKYQKEVKNEDKKELDKNNFNKYFPKPYWYTWEGKFDHVYWTNWNFIEGPAQLYNTCALNNTACANNQGYIRHSTWKGTYEWDGESWYEGWCNYLHYGKYCDNIYNWSGDSNDVSDLQWWEFMYREGDNSKNKYDLKEWLDTFHKGRWRRVRNAK